MKKAFSNRIFAVAVLVAVVALSSVLRAGASLRGLRSEAAAVFAEGSDGDGFSIQSDLNHRLEDAYNLVILAGRYAAGEEAEAVLFARQALTDAAGPAAKYRANLALTDAVEQLSATLEACPLSEGDALLLRRTLTGLRSRNDTISHDGYNAAARRYNDRLGAFPAGMLAALTGVEPLELFA